MNSSIERLAQIVQEKAVLHGEFTLTSGGRSSHYIDARRITHDPKALLLIQTLVFQAIRCHQVEAIGGPATGANPIVSAVLLHPDAKDYPLQGFFVRSQRKDHGAESLMEGVPLKPGMHVALVDDTLTTGGSILHAAEAVRAEKCAVACIVVLVDRQQGGAERIRNTLKCPVITLLKADEQGNISVAGI
jgi:orotate phosphoribosyltransferase